MDFIYISKLTFYNSKLYTPSFETLYSDIGNFYNFTCKTLSSIFNFKNSLIAHFWNFFTDRLLVCVNFFFNFPSKDSNVIVFIFPNVIYFIFFFQKNSFDCGIYVMKFMELWDGRKLHLHDLSMVCTFFFCFYTFMFILSNFLPISYGQHSWQVHIFFFKNKQYATSVLDCEGGYQHISSEDCKLHSETPKEFKNNCCCEEVYKFRHINLLRYITYYGQTHYACFSFSHYNSPTTSLLPNPIHPLNTAI